MFFAGVNADFASYRTKVAFGLTKRQIICFIIAAIFGLPVYFLTKEYIGVDMAGFLMILIMSPFFMLALYSKNGMPLEVVIKHYIKEQFLSNKVRVVSTTPVALEVQETAKFKDGTNNKNGSNMTQMTKDYANVMKKGTFKGKSPRTAGESLPIKKMYENGLCELEDGRFSVMLEVSDMNYHQLDSFTQKDVVSSYCMMYNGFDYCAEYQWCFFNHKADVGEISSKIEIDDSSADEEAKQVIGELNDTYRDYISTGNKGLSKEKYLIVTFEAPRHKVVSKANEFIERIKNDLNDKLGVSAKVLTGYERLYVLFRMLNPDPSEKMIFDWSLARSGGVSEKEQIINHPFVFGKKSDRFEVGGKVACVSYLKLDAAQISDRFLTKLLDLDTEQIVSIQIKPVNREKAIKDVRRLVSDIQKMIIDEQKSASNRGYSMSQVSASLKAHLDEAEKTLTGLTQNDEKMFMVVISMVNYADSVNRLERDFNLSRAVINEESCELIKLEHQQEDGFITSLPLGVNRIETRRQLTTTSLGLLIPFKIKELMQLNKGALCFGKNKVTGNIITADLKMLANPNTLILGTPGRGKSVSIKLIILQIMYKLLDFIFICDPEGEFGALVRKLGGEVIKLSQSGENHINMYDISPDEEDMNAAVNDKSQLTMSMFEQIMGPEKSEPIDKSIIDRAVRKSFSKFMKTRNPKDLPILEDIYNNIAILEGDRAKYLKEVLEVYVHGALNFFNHRTNVNMNNRLISFDIKDMGDQLKPLAMLIVQETVWKKVAENRKKRIYTWYICDEFHLLLKDPQTALYSKEIYKRFRKWGGIPVGITQNVTDLLESSQAQSIFYNSDCFILLGQSSGDADKLSEALKLSNEQYKCILTRNKGEGLLIYGDTVLPFVNRFDENTEVYKLITTKVTEAEV